MPRWVLFDCGELPGIVFGFACAARELPAAARAAYGAAAEPDEALVPLSMWVAIRCADPDVWLGHNLSSVNEVLGEAPLRGLATLTKGLGVRLTRAKAQIGATQWASPSASLHLAFGEMRLLSAWTPAHTHPATFSYRIEIDPARLLARMGSPPVSSPGSPSPPPPHDLCVESTDEGSFRRLQRDIEAGAQVTLVGVDHGPLGPSGRPARPSRMYLRVGSIGAPGAA